MPALPGSFALLLGGALAAKMLSQKLDGVLVGDFARKQLADGIAMIAGDDQATALTQAVHELPEAVGGELSPSLFVHDRRPVRLVLVQVNERLVGPLVPDEQPRLAGHGGH